ncbi:MAG: hypothetical protein ACPL1K_02135 [Candidatus Kryptoniota bacterium]|jgi:hypothetical protein
MISFSEFLKEEVAATTRQGITHLQDMKPEEFIGWIKSVKAAGGVLSNYKTVMKIDGLGARFGRAANGQPFFEGSRTGPIFDSGAFSAYAIAKGASDEIVLRARHYDDMLEIFKSASFMKVIPNDTKVVCEIFYNPMAKDEGDGITFVTVKYDKSKLGSLMSIMPYTVLQASTGLEHPRKEEILNALYKESNETIRIINPNLKMHSIDVSGIIDTVSTLEDGALEVIKSRKAADKEAKQNILAIIQKAKDELASYLLAHPGIEGKFKLGQNIEGIVIHINNKPYKITTDEFKATKRKP